MITDPNLVGAFNRVRSYIADEHAWELAAMPPDGSLESFRERTREFNLTGTHPVDQAMYDRLQERGKSILAAREQWMDELQRIAERHWIGERWKEEAAALRSPPKHDPEREIVTGAKSSPDGSVEVMTTMMDVSDRTKEIRTYRVERHGDDWRIRSYTYSFDS